MTSLVQNPMAIQETTPVNGPFPFRPRLRIFAGPIKSKDRPWSAAKTVEKILGDVYFDYPEQSIRFNPADTEGERSYALEQQALGLLFESGWIALKKYAAVGDRE